MIGDDLARLAYLGLLLVAVAGFVLVEFRGRPGQALRQAAAWAMIFLGLMALAGLRHDIWDAIRPQPRFLPGDRIELPMGSDGHFHLSATVNGADIRFVVDTGASSIALSQTDARRAGLDPDRLSYTGQARTANGLVETAPVVLERVELGQISDSRVPAVVLRGDLEQSLLGMSYLSRFARVSIEGRRMILER
ncbi:MULTISPECIES: retropepsin-like aspartic protease family protein [unclassified Paracoccus (in: a-proteobacteria)]|uniref:retropepsin-like aspartic protease family protein n=1 Tax=unclassified Paracoccus (in: a-proteobacteria) TaxID=2688777 RepID=UPI0021E126C5|nr:MULTISPECIES: TIGR02281 family clan AA aspartic protease [unclassified Paracoccus (in: a-proteobacteria)]UXU73754.1 TIGR02281 family clan AA aspartic protease [Paracoccus sp. SMMA_5]UXU79644.1 TIGR02281 family clan AA aspartic protease [Paracoccus sp. SMMA_5_TC]